MTLADKIDRCGFRALVLLAFWLIASRLGTSMAEKIIVTFAASLCVIGCLERVRGKKEMPAAEATHRAPLMPRIKELARAALTRKNARRFMTVALLLLVFSLFVAVPVWYYVMIAVNVVIVCLCLAAGHRT